MGLCRRHSEEVQCGDGVGVALDEAVKACGGRVARKDEAHRIEADGKLGVVVRDRAVGARCAVAAAARGKGVGKQLLQWAEAQARAHSSTVLTLAVLNGNPARRLYERFGFEEVPTDGCEQCINSCVVCFIIGRPYGLCDPHAGTIDMRKRLANDPQA